MSLTDSLVPFEPLPPIQVDVPVPVPTGQEPEEIFPTVEVEPWWMFIVEAAVDFLVDFVLRPAIEAVIEAVEWMIAELRYWKHLFFELLAELYDTNLGFLMLTVATIVAAIYIPQLVLLIKDSSIGKLISSIFDWVKKSTGRLLELIGFIDLVAISQMLEVVWPEWRTLMAQLSDVTSALAEELGQGSAYISAWFSTVHSFALLGVSFLDIDPRAAELRAFEETDSFLKHINENFRKYAHDPGLIIRDIIENIYIPYAIEFQDGQQDVIKSVGENRDTIWTHYSLLKDLEDNLVHFIEIQPEETAAIVEAKLGPIAESLGSFLDDFATNVLPRIDGALTVLNQRADWIEQANKSAAEKIDNPFYSIAMYELMSGNKQAAYNHVMALMAGAESVQGEAITRPIVKEMSKLFTDLLVTGAEEHQRLPILELEPITSKSISAYLTVSRSSWFVGDY